jgi:hypothetical protein
MDEEKVDYTIKGRTKIYLFHPPKMAAQNVSFDVEVYDKFASVNFT